LEESILINFADDLQWEKIINHLKARNNTEHNFHKTKEESTITWNLPDVQITSHRYSENIFDNILKTNIDVRMNWWQRNKYIHALVFGSTLEKEKCFWYRKICS